MTTTKERDVIDAAKAVREARRNAKPGETGMYEHCSETLWRSRLCDAVDALTASQPISPEMLVPGEKFLWPKGTEICIAVLERELMWYCPQSNISMSRFKEGDLVIPIQDGEEKAELAATSSNCPACDHIVVHDVGLPTVNCPRCNAEFIPHA